MNEGWKLIRFGNLCELTRGHNPPKSKFINEPKEGYVRFYQIRDGWSEEHKVYVPETPQLHTVLPDDMLMVAYRHIGRVFRGVTGAFNVALCKISNKSTEILDNDFLFYMIPSEIIRGELMKRSERSLIPSMSVEHLKSLQIPIPPLSEQKQIVAILDKAFAAIDQAQANIEKNIENAKELFQSKLNAIFSRKGDGWQEKSLGEVCSVLNGFAFKSKDAIPSSNTQLLRMGNLYQNILDLNRKPVFYPDSFAKEYNSYLLKEGDLIMSLTGTVDKTDYGYTVKIPRTDVKLLLNQRIMKIDIKNNDILNKDYLRHYLLSPDFLKRLYATASGTRQANLSSRTILTLTINFPSDVNKQSEVVSLLEYLSQSTIDLEKYYQRKLDNLEDLKKSILQKAFSGELTKKEVMV